MLVGRVTVTSMLPTVVAATIPAVDPTAYAIPAAKAHTASSGRNVASRPAARYPRKVPSARPTPAPSAMTLRGRQVRWNVAAPAE
ncbi:hypothetical protein GCM10010425_30200 [Streptomyces spororaveus]|uniref:Secreted protein n=1 Tax=Streptomyces spororaveus TaxID=284039 RepID=A0ABQ3T612_9ACTN|nr:hypothetical protein Sspor_14040 [Streptomyces spororaveus]